MRAAAALLLCLSLPARALADDRPEFSGECHPPVLGVIDPDWQQEALRFKEQTLRAFAQTEGPDGARRQLRAALQVAESTRASAYEVLQLTRELLLRGLRGRELETLRAAALDAQAAFGSEGGGRLLRAVVGLRGRPALTEAELKDLDELLGRAALREALGRRLGGKGDAELLRALGTQRLSDGSVDGAAASAAALDALLRLGGHGQPGAAARAQLASCIQAMSRTCARKDAEAHCKSTPRPYLELLQKEP